VIISDKFHEILNKEKENNPKFICKIEVIIKELGLYALNIYLDLVREKFKNEDFLNSLKEELKKENDLNTNMSNKILLLLNELKKYKDQKDFYAIIFVERRETTQILKKIIQDKLSIECDNFTGHGDKNDLIKNDMNITKQRKVIDNFREIKYKILIATNVAEEGVDIQRVNFVFRFDQIHDIKSYVQSKGRARSIDSKYFVFIDENDENSKEYVNKLKMGEESMNKECISNKDRDILEIESNNNDENAFKTKNGIYVTLDSSIPIIDKLNPNFEINGNIYIMKSIMGIEIKFN
jgi:ERCC4-related helicase